MPLAGWLANRATKQVSMSLLVKRKEEGRSAHMHARMTPRWPGRPTDWLTDGLPIRVIRTDVCLSVVWKKAKQQREEKKVGSSQSRVFTLARKRIVARKMMPNKRTNYEVWHYQAGWSIDNDCRCCCGGICCCPSRIFPCAVKILFIRRSRDKSNNRKRRRIQSIICTKKIYRWLSLVHRVPVDR